MNEQSIALDLAKKFAGKQTVYVGAGDVGGTSILATVTSAGKAVNLTGMDAALMLPLGSVACSISNGKVSCLVDEALVPEGTEHAYIALDDGERVYSTQRFRIVTLDGDREA